MTFSHFKSISLTLLLAAVTLPATAQVRKPAPSDTPPSMMEKLDRGLVVIPMGATAAESDRFFVSWRLLGTDDANTTFTILRNGKPAGGSTTDMGGATSATVGGSASDDWQVVTLVGGDSVGVTPAVKSWSGCYLPVHMSRPEGGVLGGRAYSYEPNDCSVGDVDGDGQYEIIVKWNPTNAHDNAHIGLTGKVYIDCYKLDGTRLWRIDLGRNIRAGAHYTQFLVYDFDGDGRAEMICKTAAGSIDGRGNYVNQAATDAAIRAQDNNADYRFLTMEGKKLGMVLDGPEYLTVFNGATGAAVHTIYYNPNRAGNMDAYGKYPPSDFWGDDYGNRSERYLAAVAYLDGVDANPSAVMCRGYYTKAYLWAVGFDGARLKTKWIHASVSRTETQVYDSAFHKATYTYGTNTFGVPVGKNGDYCYTAWGQGAHSLSVGDVDFDGKDEITYGAAAIDDDGRLLYSTGLGHGDAQHLGDFDPDRPGYEYFMVHESSPYGYEMRDAATGEKILYGTSFEDTGRGIMADVDSACRGAEFTYAAQPYAYDIRGGKIGRYFSMNFRVFWDGDPYEELLDGNRIMKYSARKGSTMFTLNGRPFGSYGNSVSCSGSKATPCVSADLFGDWREEVVWWDRGDAATLNIFSSTIPTGYRVPTLMHDHVYRLGVAHENVAYNQPPHLGYYLPDYIGSFGTGK